MLPERELTHRAANLFDKLWIAFDIAQREQWMNLNLGSTSLGGTTLSAGTLLVTNCSILLSLLKFLTATNAIRDRNRLMSACTIRSQVGIVNSGD